MTDSLLLEAALERYELALDFLEKPEAGEETSLVERVLEVLLARHSVQAVLEDSKSVLTSTFLRLDEQDSRLKACRGKIHRTRQLSNWRSLINPPQKAWWWYLEPPALFAWLEKSHPLLDRFDWLWKFLTLVALAISITFILNTLQRVLAGGLDTTGIFAVMVQTILVLAGGSTLTQHGREALESVLNLVRIPKYYWQELSTCLSVLFLGIVICIHSFYLPQMATNFYQNGMKQYASGEIGSAMSYYQQAIALRPDYIEAHHALGVLYERLQQSDKAIKEYQQVIQGDSETLSLLTRLRVRNDLGYLYIANKKYSDAWLVLEEGLSLMQETTQADQEILHEKYSLLKNLGWLRLQEKHYIDADIFLRQAIELNAERASAYCLQAEVLEGKKEEKEAIPYWENCIRYSVSSHPDDAMRSATAREKLAGRKRL